MLGDMPMQAVIRYWGTVLRTDGLVTKASALDIGHVNNPELNLVFGMSSTIYNLGHLGLLGSQDAYRTILCFFGNLATISLLINRRSCSLPLSFLSCEWICDKGRPRV